MQKYKYVFMLPSVNINDNVVSRKLHKTVNNVQEIVELDPTLVEFELILSENDVVSLFLVDVDAADNKSEPSDTLQFVVLDTVPPRKPGNIVLNVAAAVVVEEPAAVVVEEKTVTIEELNSSKEEVVN